MGKIKDIGGWLAGLAVFVCLVALFVTVYCGTAVAEEAGVDLHEAVEACLTSKAEMLGRTKYLECEESILRDYSGSGGYFLTAGAMQWIREGRAALRARGVRLPNQRRIHAVFGDSFYNTGEYAKALEEFRLARDGYGQDISEWMSLNAAIARKGGKATAVKARQDPTKVEATRTCELEAGDTLYLGLFKGGVYSYDKRKKEGILLYLPPYQYDWPVALSLDGTVLTIKHRDDDVVRYDLETREFTREAEKIDTGADYVIEIRATYT